MARDFTITLEEAKKRCTEWNTDQKKIQTALLDQPTLHNLPVLTSEGFTFELADLFDLFIRIYKYNNPNKPNPILPTEHTIKDPINAIRFYLGKETFLERPISPIACLIGVAVTGFDSDANDGGQDVQDLPQTTIPPLKSSIYDFSFPCPGTCADSGTGINH